MALSWWDRFKCTVLWSSPSCRDPLELVLVLADESELALWAPDILAALLTDSSALDKRSEGPISEVAITIVSLNIDNRQDGIKHLWRQGVSICYEGQQIVICLYQLGCIPKQHWHQPQLG